MLLVAVCILSFWPFRLSELATEPEEWVQVVAELEGLVEGVVAVVSLLLVFSEGMCHPLVMPLQRREVLQLLRELPLRNRKCLSSLNPTFEVLELLCYFHLEGSRGLSDKKRVPTSLRHC